MIDQQTIDRIFESADIVDVVSTFVQLKRRGSNWIGLCPFHDEKTPSFTVNPVKGIYKCFGCGKGGNAVTFIMEHEKLTYPEALRFLAKKYNIPIEESEEQNEERQQKKSLRDQLYHVHQLAHGFYVKQLWETDEGRSVGLGYFLERGMSENTIKTFGLGYSPADKTALIQYLLKNGIEETLIEQSGIGVRYGQTLVDRFHDRVIFPLQNITGRVIGFAGRILVKTDKAKYVNSPETLIYEKGKYLFGLYYSKNAIVKNAKAFLVEGYMDFLSLYESGITNVVAGSGTAFTSEQIKLLKRFTKHITLIYDSDAAGYNAAEKAAHALLFEDLDVSIVPLPAGEDPDSLAKKLMPGELQNYVSTNEQDFILYQLSKLPPADRMDPRQKRDAVNQLLQSVACIKDVILRSSYIQKIAAKLRVDESALSLEAHKLHLKLKEETLNRQARENLKLPSPTQGDETIENESSEDDRNITAVDPLVANAEAEYLRLLIEHGDKNVILTLNNDGHKEEIEINVAVQMIIESEEDGFEFSHPLYKKVFDFYKSLYKQNIDHHEIVKKIKTHNDAEFVNLYVSLTENNFQLSEKWKKEWHVEVTERDQFLERVFEHVVRSFKIVKINEKLEVLRKKLKETPQDSEDILFIIQEINKYENFKKEMTKSLGWTIL